MDFDDYLNKSNQLDSQEAKTELENYYAFNSGLLSFFTAIDNQVKAVMNSANINPQSAALIQSQVDAVKPMLNKLRFEINMFDAGSLSEAYKADINKTIGYIKGFMEVGEVDITANQLFALLQKNETAFAKEQEERKRQEREEKERIAREEAERKIREERERKEREEAERKAKEEKERQEREEKEREIIENIEIVFVKGSNKIRDFYIGKYPVTQKLWQAVMGNNPSYFKGDGRLPVENVSWDDAQAFISKLNSITGKIYRLPSEMEWEYAAREGEKQSAYEYSGSDNADEVAWYIDNSEGRTHNVGTKKPNALGIYDMSGNTWEWCEDYDDLSSVRVLRGGRWSSNAWLCRVAYRDSYTPVNRDYNFGFRLALQNNVGVKSEILICLKTNPTLSAKELAVLLNKTQRTIERNIKDLREQGVLKREGSDKTGFWEISINEKIK
jgi:hypothetical protein